MRRPPAQVEAAHSDEEATDRDRGRDLALLVLLDLRLLLALLRTPKRLREGADLLARCLLSIVLKKIVRREGRATREFFHVLVSCLKLLAEKERSNHGDSLPLMVRST